MPRQAVPRRGDENLAYLRKPGKDRQLSVPLDDLGEGIGGIGRTRVRCNEDPAAGETRLLTPVARRFKTLAVAQITVVGLLAVKPGYPGTVLHELVAQQRGKALEVCGPQR